MEQTVKGEVAFSLFLNVRKLKIPELTEEDMHLVTHNYGFVFIPHCLSKSSSLLEQTLCQLI